jgi:ferric-dicitrate binding protein FerR (iron transport regulator)
MFEKEKYEPLQYVLRHYRRGLFDPARAVGIFREKAGTVGAWKARRTVRLLAAAAVVAVVFVSGMTLHHKKMNRWEEISTASVVLPDHSVVRLKSGATLAFQPLRFTKDRTVRLNGIAYFEVAGDPIPFQVLSEDACVRVLGTKFQFDADRGVVDLLEGNVLFARQDSDRGLQMAGRSHAVLSDGSDIPVFTEPDSPNPAVWATGRLIYEVVPLRVVLDELEVVFGQRLTVKPSSAAGMSLTGEFLVSDGLEHIRKALESALKVEIVPYE